MNIIIHKVILLLKKIKHLFIINVAELKYLNKIPIKIYHTDR